MSAWRGQSTRRGRGTFRRSHFSRLYHHRRRRLCGYVNRSQSKYICTHRCNAARGARCGDRDAIVPRASCSFDILFAPRDARSAATSATAENFSRLMRFDSAIGTVASLCPFRLSPLPSPPPFLCLAYRAISWDLAGRSWSAQREGRGETEDFAAALEWHFFATRDERGDKIRERVSRIKVTKITL